MKYKEEIHCLLLSVVVSFLLYGSDAVLTPKPSPTLLSAGDDPFDDSDIPATLSCLTGTVPVPDPQNETNWAKGTKKAVGCTGATGCQQPIRLTFDTKELDPSGVLTDNQKSILMDLLKDVSTFFGRLFSIERIAGPLILQPTDYCRDSSITVTDPLTTNGIKSTDMVLFVNARSIDDPYVLANAYACQFHPNTSRPVAGVVNINVKGQFYSLSTERQTAVLRHEIMHAMGFSPGLFSEYRNANNTRLTEVTRTKTVLGGKKTITMIVTPKVVQAARTHFNCSDIEGVELEDQGGDGTAGTHWEARLMLNDVMSGYLPQPAYLSPITLALFEDMGWYKVNYSLAQQMPYGLNAGCEFVDPNVRCLSPATQPTSNFPDYFAVVPPNTKSVSTFCGQEPNYISYAQTTTYSSSNIPDLYRYWTGSDIGSSFQVADFCPVIQPFQNCEDPNNTKKKSFVWGMTFAPGSRCIKYNNFIDEQYTGKLPGAGCVQVYCTSSSSLVLGFNYRGSIVNVTCPSAGSDVTVPGFSGTATCPVAAELCAPPPECPKLCSGRGQCVNGVCVCASGYAEPDCYGFAGVKANQGGGDSGQNSTTSTNSSSVLIGGGPVGTKAPAATGTRLPSATRTVTATWSRPPPSTRAPTATWSRQPSSTRTATATWSRLPSTSRAPTGTAVKTAPSWKPTGALATRVVTTRTSTRVATTRTPSKDGQMLRARA